MTSWPTRCGLGPSLLLCAVALACGRKAAPPAPSHQGQSRAETTDSERAGGSSVEPPTTPPGVQLKTTQGPLRLASWNLEWLDEDIGGGPMRRSAQDYAALRRVQERLDADVIAIQEIESARAAALVFPSDSYQIWLSRDRVPQKTGFAVRQGLTVRQNEDLVALKLGGLRSAADITIETPRGPLRLLSVHLKSGCFEGDLTRTKACKKFSRQVPVVESWIEARTTEGVLFAVLGDFNRRLFHRPDEPVWADWNDGTPLGLALWSPTQGATARCQRSKYPHFIDHIIADASLKRFLVSNSFAQTLYSQADEHRRLSDHCPISVSFELGKLPRLALQRSQPLDEADELGAAVGAEMRATRFAKSQLIKGNISHGGRKIYHLPSCPSYEDTKIDLKKGERFFRSRAEAEAAGWVMARNCKAPLPGEDRP